MEQRIYKPGDRVGTYEVRGLLATGGFSAIYEARDLADDTEGDRSSAIKVNLYDPRTEPLPERLLYNERHAREYKLVEGLWHRSVIRVFELQYHEGAAFYAMELLEGPTLGAFLAEGGRSLNELMLSYRQLVGALGFCHRRGVVHRDLKPSNIIITRPGRRFVPSQEAELPRVDHEELDELPFLEKAAWQPVLIDFGISQELSLRPVTAPGFLVGSRQYLSPEYARALRSGKVAREAHRAQPHEDVYQAGVVLYEVLTGELPTRTPPTELEALLEEICEGEPVPVLERNPEAPPHLAALAMECLAKQGMDRPRDGVALTRRVRAGMRADQAALQQAAPKYRQEDGLEPSGKTEAQAMVRAVASAPGVGGLVSVSSSGPAAPMSTATSDASVSGAVFSATPAVSAGSAPGATASGSVAAPGAGAPSQVSASTAGNAGQTASSPAVGRAGAAPQGDRGEASGQGRGFKPMEGLCARACSALRSARAVQAAVVGVVLCALLLTFISGMDRLLTLFASLAAAQSKLASAQEQYARAEEAHANAERQLAEQLKGALKTPSEVLIHVTGGLKMPEKPDPRWLKPGPDGKCRHPQTGEMLHGYVVRRGACWSVAMKPDPQDRCSNDWYDAPPEAPPEDCTRCYLPFSNIVPPQSVTPK